MRRAGALIAIVLVAALTGCSPGQSDDLANEANKLCSPHGGVLSVDWHGEAYVCADHIARGFH